MSTVKLVAAGAGPAPSVDLLIFAESVKRFERSLMAPTTALGLVLLGAALALTASSARRAVLAAQLCAAGALGVGTMGLIGHLYGAITLVEFGRTGTASASAMSLPTAICMISAAVGTLWMRPSLAITGIITGQTLGGATARRMIPVIIVTTVTLGAARAMLTRQGVLDELTGVAILTTSLLAIFIVTVLTLAGGLRRVSLRLAARDRALGESATALAAARDQAEAAAKLKSDFMANMSHEIRTPLTAIIGYADRLTRRSDLHEAARREISRVDTAAHALLSIVNDVLDFSRLEAGQVTIRPRPTSPRAVAADALQLFEQQAATKGLRLEFDCDERVPPQLLVDPDRLQQILLNLIGNAVKFTPSGSVRVFMGYGAGAGPLEVQVEDTGPGVPTQQQARIFHRFARIEDTPARWYGGSGLGLAICKGLVEAMQGEIGVRPRPGGGSIFHFSFPAPAAETPSATLPTASDFRLAGVRVLVVDDEPANRDLVSSILAPLGVEVREAVDGVDGVAQAMSTPFDSILMDIRMPHLDGYQAAGAIRGSNGPNRDTPIVAFSATLELSGAQGDRAVFSGFVRKPFIPEDLVSALAHCRQTSPAAGATQSSPA